MGLEPVVFKEQGHFSKYQDGIGKNKGAGFKELPGKLEHGEGTF